MDFESLFTGLDRLFAVPGFILDLGQRPICSAEIVLGYGIVHGEFFKSADLERLLKGSDGGRGLGESLERLNSALHIDDGGQNKADLNGVDLEGLWQAYYDSQYCPERKNMAAFRRHMPRRDQQAAGLRLVQNKRMRLLRPSLAKVDSCNIVMIF